MCEVLIRVVDKTSPIDVYNYAAQSKRGDVIVVVPDGWAWSELEKTNPDWRIFKVPGVSEEEAAVILQPEIPTIDNLNSRTLQFRGFYIDLDSPLIEPEFATYIANHARTPPWAQVPLTYDVFALKTKRPPIPDPAII